MGGEGKQEYISGSTEETRALGQRWARSAFPGQIICLDGDLGAGKTVFAQGFAEGLGIRSHVTSPTFTILQIYRGGRIPLYHFDVYRIEETEEMEAIGYEEFFYGDGVCLVEWSENIQELIPSYADRIRINRITGKEDTGRLITWISGDRKADKPNLDRDMGRPDLGGDMDKPDHDGDMSRSGFDGDMGKPNLDGDISRPDCKGDTNRSDFQGDESKSDLKGDIK